MGGSSGSQTQSTQSNQTQTDLLNSLVQKLQQQRQTSNSSVQGSQTGTQAVTGSQSSVGTGVQNQTSGTTQNQQQTGTGVTTTNLAAGQQPNVDLLLAGARDAYTAGSTDPLQAQARALSAQYAQNGVGGDLINKAQQGAGYFLDTKNLFNTSSIPGFDAAQAGVTQAVNRNLMENILPQIRAGSIMNNTLGGSAQGISEGKAVADTSSNLGQILANMQLQAYQQNLGQYNNAQAQLPQTYGLGLLPSQVLESTGAANVADRNAGLNLLQQITGGAGTYGGSTTTQNQGQVTGSTQGTAQSTSQQTSSGQTAQNATDSSQTSQQSTQTIDDILQSLGLSNSSGTSTAQGSSTSTGTVSQGSSPLQALGTLISLGALFL